MEEQISLDDVLSKFSIFGRYHMKLVCFLSLLFASDAFQCSNYIFTAEKSRYRCNDETFENFSCSVRTNSSCTEWIYEDPRSFVAEFQIACEEWKRTLVGTMHSLGYMVGLLYIGPLSDRIGRKNTIVLTSMAGGVIGLARSFTTWYWLYIALEFLEPAIGNSCSPGFILSIEIVSTKKRVNYQCLCDIGYVLGNMLLPLVAWSVPYWRNYLRVIYTPALLFFFYTYLIDESPRWLLSRDKKNEAVAILQKMANTNKVKLDHGELANLLAVERKEKGLNLISLLKQTFRYQAMRKRFLICIVWWTTCTFVSYGLKINSVSLQGNKYINYMMMSAMQLPGNVMTMYILTNYKRRNPLIVSFFFGGVLCFIQPFLPTHLSWLSVMVYMVSKLICSFYFGITYMYTSELFPTYTRNSMHALCSSLGRIGSIIAPQTPLLMVYWPGLPSIVFGSMSFIAVAITFLAPDTANTPLPDTIRQAAAIGTKIKGIDNIAMTQDIQTIDKQNVLPKDPKLGIDNL